MALTPETGAIVENADSYVSLAAADTYFTNHGSPSEWTGATDAVKESALRYATQWIDATFSWRGEVVSNDQVLDWPRAGVYDDEDRYVDSASLPRLLKDATCEAALEHIRDALNVGKDRGGMVKRTKLGPLEKEFADYAPGDRPRRFVAELLAPLLGYSSTGLRLVRA